MGEALEALANLLETREEIAAVFSIFRMKRHIEVLAITNFRIVTLGFKLLGGVRTVDSIALGVVRSFSVARSGFSIGRIDLHLEGQSVHLGTMNGAHAEGDWQRLEELLNFRSQSGAPTRYTSTLPIVQAPAYPPTIGTHGDRVGSSPTDLKRRFAELAENHSRGELTDEEFAEAKARAIVP